ncbi:MAG: hypothetical protein LIR46_13465 [Bacteroidota bacterium]|nr:hypothetical protein [Bacteroidota bacterium]
MKIFDNALMRTLTSGFGTDTAAGKAVGMTIALFIVFFVIAYYCIKWAVKLILMLVGKSVPNLKAGKLYIQLDSIGVTPHLLLEQLLEINGYDERLAKKVMSKVPSVIVKGLDAQSADDFVTILEHTGAHVSIVEG